MATTAPLTGTPLAHEDVLRLQAELAEMGILQEELILCRQQVSWWAEGATCTASSIELLFWPAISWSLVELLVIVCHESYILVDEGVDAMSLIPPPILPSSLKSLRGSHLLDQPDCQCSGP